LANYFHTLEVDQAGEILHVRFNRPDQMNAFNAQMGDELSEVFGAGLRASGAAVVVLSGNGGAFMAGADLEQLERWATLGSEALQAELSAGFQAKVIEDVAVPVIAAVDGVAFGLGLDIVLACDFAIASERAVFSLPETNVGVVPMGASTHHLPHLLGMGRAARVILLGERFKAADALAWGVVMEVVPPDELATAADALAAKVTERSRSALAAAKRLLRSWPADPASAIAAECAAFERCLTEPDSQEGIAALRERRRPTFGSTNPTSTNEG
jgi:enoyl-CoA hydratase